MLSKIMLIMTTIRDRLTRLNRPEFLKEYQSLNPLQKFM
jgi:hypothetical protein